MSFTKTPLKQPASQSAPPSYKRGTIVKNGKLYGRYPDGSLYRIYSTARPFLQLVDVGGKTFLRIRQATEQGYTDCPCPGAADLSYPSSALRRSRRRKHRSAIRYAYGRRTSQQCRGEKKSTMGQRKETSCVIGFRGYNFR